MGPLTARSLSRRSFLALTDLGLLSTWLFPDPSLLHIHLAGGFTPPLRKDIRIVEIHPGARGYMEGGGARVELYRLYDCLMSSSFVSAEGRWKGDFAPECWEEVRTKWSRDHRGMSANCATSWLSGLLERWSSSWSFHLGM